MSAPEGTVGWSIESNSSRLYGYIARQVADSSIVEDLVQDTWLEVWRRVGTFDAERAGFWRFTRIWADFVIRRHRAATAEQRCAGCPRTTRSDCARRNLRARCRGPGRTPAPGVPMLAALVSVDERLETVEASAELLERLSRCPRPPHEVIVFGYSKLGWKPRDVVSELADVSLDALGARLECEYAFMAPAAHRYFAPLRARLRQPLSEAMVDPRTRQLYPALLSCRAGMTTVREYFPMATERAAAAAVVHWWHAVQRSLIAETVRAGRGQLFEWMRGAAAWSEGCRVSCVRLQGSGIRDPVLGIRCRASGTHPTPDPRHLTPDI